MDLPIQWIRVPLGGGVSLWHESLASGKRSSSCLQMSPLAVQVCGIQANVLPFHVTRPCGVMIPALDSSLFFWAENAKCFCFYIMVKLWNWSTTNSEGISEHVTYSICQVFDWMFYAPFFSCTELRVFPDRFVICVTRLESSSPLCMREYVAPVRMKGYEQTAPFYCLLLRNVGGFL